MDNPFAPTRSSKAKELEVKGRIWLRRALDRETLLVLDKLGQGVSGRISAEKETAIALSKGGPVSDLLTPLLPGAFPTRIVLFDKSANHNWSVPWHQDRIITVKGKKDCEGFTNWSCKGGAWHCEPPGEVFRNMLFLRLHLDNDTAENGPMELALGSHRSGAISASDAATVAASYEIETSTGRRGDILVMNMLVLHRSRPATIPTQRRVLRVDYANGCLPEPLEWDIPVP